MHSPSLQTAQKASYYWLSDSSHGKFQFKLLILLSVGKLRKITYFLVKSRYSFSAYHLRTRRKYYQIWSIWLPYLETSLHNIFAILISGIIEIVVSCFVENKVTKCSICYLFQFEKLIARKFILFFIKCTLDEMWIFLN